MHKLLVLPAPQKTKATMRYTSTRNTSTTVTYTFEEAITSGYAPDGGLFVPTHLPSIDAATLQSWSKFTFPQLAHSILRLFVSPEEINDDDLNCICNASYGNGAFDNGVDGVVKVRKLKSGLFVSELFHGPTFCFKDLGMRPLINLLSHYSTIRTQSITLLVSTTGDTGPAAVQAVADANNPLLTLLVHYPNGQISDFQRKQLTTAHSPYVKVATFEGGGDDMDLVIKRLLTSQNDKEEEGEKKRRLCGVNSYNIGRPLMQMVHFVWTYLRVVEDLGVNPGDPNVIVDIVLPTGAMGNIVGGYMAKKMGLPLGYLCSGVNVNDITHRVMETGRFHKSEGGMVKTMSEAINIQVPYNFERLLYYLTNENSKLVKSWMTTMDETSKLNLDKNWLNTLQNEFRSARITDAEMCHIMNKVVDVYDGYVVDPHTAVAFSAAEKLGYDILCGKKKPTEQPDEEDGGQHTDQDERQQQTKQCSSSSPVAILATASPCKFQEVVTLAIGTRNWEAFHERHFPQRAKDVMCKTEVPPTVYKWTDGCVSLREVQIDWERMARDLIEQLGSLSASGGEGK